MTQKPVGTLTEAGDYDAIINSPAQGAAAYWVAVIFAAVIAMTAGLTVAGYRAWPELAENRTLASFPDASGDSILSAAYFSQISDWASDQQAFKVPLVALHSASKLFAFQSALDGQTLVGMDGWYYYGLSSMVDDFTGRARLEDDDQYLRAVLIYLEELYYYGKFTGRTILFLPAPNKHNIYPQHYAPGYVFAGIPNKSAKIEAWLRKYYPEMSINLTEALLDAGAEKELYYKTDTHWNARGAHLAIERLIAAAGRDNPKLLFPMSIDYQEQSAPYTRGNFATLLALPLVEDEPILSPELGFAATTNVSMQDNYSERFSDLPRRIDVMDGPQNDRPRLMIIGDSFMSAMLPFAAEVFSHSMFINPWNLPNVPKNRFPQGVITDFNPDIIAVEVVERRIRPCRPTRTQECLDVLNGQMAQNVRQMRLRYKFDDGVALAGNPQPRVVHDDAKFYLNLLPEGQSIPEGEIVVARVTIPAGSEGRLMAFAARLPIEVRQEQTAINITPEMTDAYIVLPLSSDRRVSVLKWEGDVDPRQLQFEIRHFTDQTSVAAFLAASAETP